MNIKIFQFNPVGENTYLLYDDSKECVVIDAGNFFPEENEVLLSFIKDNELTLKHLLNTHLHFDHILGNIYIKEQFGLDTGANEGDEYLMNGLPAQMRMFGFSSDIQVPRIGKYLKEGDVVKFGKQKLHVLHVPGHSPGSLAFYNAEAGCVFVGDVLFNSSIGRTDLTGGDFNTLINSINTKLLTLPSDTVVYPGHGLATTIGAEMKNNPYL